jgi:hypothetical protein
MAILWLFRPDTFSFHPMQRILFLALLSGASAAAQAQTVIKAGTTQLGGSVNYFHQSSESTGNNRTNGTSNSFSVVPTIGYFVADNLALGISGGFSTDNSQTTIYYSYDTSFSERKNKSFSIGPFAQYYHLLTEKFGVSGTLGALYTHGKYEYFSVDTKNSTYNDVTTGNGVYATLVPSLLFFPISKLALGASFGGLSYSYNASEQPNDLANSGSHNTTFGAVFGLNQLYFSGTYYFNRQ